MLSKEKMDILFEMYNDGLISKQDLADSIKTMNGNSVRIEDNNVKKIEKINDEEVKSQEIKRYVVLGDGKSVAFYDKRDVDDIISEANSNVNFVNKMEYLSNALINNGVVGAINLTGSIKFIHIVDNQYNVINDDTSRLLKDTIVKVSFSPRPTETLLSPNENVINLLNSKVSGYVKFSDFMQSLDNLGYSMRLKGYGVEGQVQEYIKNNKQSRVYENLNLSALENSARDGDCVLCDLVKTRDLENYDSNRIVR